MYLYINIFIERECSRVLMIGESNCCLSLFLQIFCRFEIFPKQKGGGNLTETFSPLKDRDYPERSGSVGWVSS